jgi:uncharacterized protein YkwD
MAKTKTPRTHTRNHTKRHGLHHKKSTNYIKTYAPYLPLFVSIIASLLLSMWQPHHGATLAYATNTSLDGLLQSTNVQRAAHSRSALTTNSLLAQAAQDKANDMAARNYWSHNTPDGEEPWKFIEAVGYKYGKAGENLAYGFRNSNDTVIGWMNSPTHRANLLDGGFTQVGFGFANSTDFVGDGNQTIVVAMYGRPLTSAATPQNSPTTSQDPLVAGTSRGDTTTPALTQNTSLTAAAGPQKISRIETLTGGSAPWTLPLVAGIMIAIIILILVRHSLKFRHLIHDIRHDTERFILHHPLLDSTLVGLLILGTVLLRTSGFIL